MKHSTMHFDGNRGAKLGATTALLVAVLGASGSAHAQAPAADKAVPRAADGHADLSGIWENGAGIEFVQPQQRGASVCVAGCGAPAGAAGAAGAPRPPAAAPAAPVRGTAKPEYKPELAAKVADLAARQVETDPILRCFAPGVPRIGPPDKIVQTSREIVFLYDDVTGNYFRVIPMDGKPLVKDGEPSYLGDAVGHWDGDTLVVETQDFNEDTWLTDDGAIHTKDLRVVERLSRTGDTLEWSATAYDPAVLAKPWELRPRLAHRTDQKVAEAAPCIDRDLDHIVDGSHHPNPR